MLNQRVGKWVFLLNSFILSTEANPCGITMMKYHRLFLPTTKTESMIILMENHAFVSWYWMRCYVWSKFIHCWSLNICYCFNIHQITCSHFHLMFIIYYCQNICKTLLSYLSYFRGYNWVIRCLKEDQVSIMPSK